jgi:hypothetical protein
MPHATTDDGVKLYYDAAAHRSPVLEANRSESGGRLKASGLMWPVAGPNNAHQGGIK